MAIEEKRPVIWYMSGYLPEDLKEITPEAIIGGLTGNYGDTVDAGANAAAWLKKEYYSDSGDNWTVLKSGDTIDLSGYDEYTSRLTLELIVGTADQLDLNNKIYKISVDVDRTINCFNLRS